MAHRDLRGTGEDPCPSNGILGRSWLRRSALAGVTLSGALVILVMALNLTGGWLTKSGCMGFGGDSMPSNCYNDLQWLWAMRDLGQHLFPYIHGQYHTSQGVVYLSHGEIEYPVLTGLFAWFAGLFAHSSGGFLVANAVLMAPFGLFAAAVLYRMAGLRALLFAAAPSVAFYSLMNWDLLAVAATVSGVWFWWRRRPYAAASLLAVGGCLKLWPAFLLVPLAMELAFSGNRRRVVGVLVTGGGVGLAVNLPFMLLNFRGWYAPFVFQSDYTVQVGSFSYWYTNLFGLTTHGADYLSWGLTAGGFAVMAALGWSRARKDRVFPFLQMAGAMVLWFALVTKAFSAQYALWILPFFVLIRLPWGLWASYVVSDGIVYLLYFAHPGDSKLLYLAVMCRSLTLVLAVVFALHRAIPATRIAPVHGEVTDERPLARRAPQISFALREACESGRDLVSF